MTSHITISIIVFLSIIFFPYWIYVPILFIAVILIPFFWEGVVFALMIETIYLGRVEIFTSLISLLSVSILLTLLIMLPVREKLRLHV